MEAALFTDRRGHRKHLRQNLTATIRVGHGSIRFNPQATCWPGVWMDAHLTLKEHHNWCMKKARAAAVRLWTLTKTYSVVPESVRAVQVACVEDVALYRSELWWDPMVVGRWDDLQLLLNRQARSILGTLHTTPRGALMRQSGPSPARVTLDSRQQWFIASLEHACSSELMEQHSNHSSGAQICRVFWNDHKHGQTTEGMNWPAPGDEPAVMTTRLYDTAAAKSTAQRWARQKEANISAGVCIWWTDGSRSDNGRVGAAALCKYWNTRRSCHSILGTRHMEVFDAKLWVIELVPDFAIEKRETLQMYWVAMVAVFSDSQGAIRHAAHMELGPGKLLATRINRRARSLLTHAFAFLRDWLPGHSGIPGNEEADGQANLSWDASGSTVIERPYTSASNRARQISKGRSAAKAD